jgi:hypothetical protein
VLTFADPEVIQLVNTQFIPVAADDWYQRRRQDKEGVFFRTLADAVGKTGPGGDTRQGMYCFAADGTPLAYKNAGNSAELLKLLQLALNKFQRLPEEKRKAGAVKVEDAGKLDVGLARTPPEGGLVLTVFTRILDYKNGDYCKGTCKVAGGDKAARDHVWLTAEEVQSLVPAKTTVGFRYPVPLKIAERLLRFHLVDNTSGEPVHWERDEIRSKRLTLKVTGQSPEAVELRLEGEALMTSKPEVEKADRGYEVRLLGSLRYVPGKKVFDRFDITAVGSHWGEPFHAGTARPGKSLLGVTFELGGDRPGDKVAPQGVREVDDYYGRK